MRLFCLTLLSTALFAYHAQAQLVSPSAAPDAEVPQLTPGSISSIGVAAVVNDKLVSSLDVEQRTRLIMMSAGLNDTEEVRVRLRPQVIRMLIDETLQIDESRKQGIEISDKDITAAIGQIEQQSGKPAGSLMQAVEARGVSPAHFLQQVRAQLAFARLVSKKVRSRIKVSDEEIERVRTQKIQTGSVEELRIYPVTLPVDSPENEMSVKQLAEKLVSEIQGGAKFEAVAGQFSGGSAEIRPEDAFWVQQAQVDPAIGAAIGKLQAGEVSSPVRTPAGYAIVKLYEKRLGTGEQETETELAIKQIELSLKPEAENKEAQLLIEIAQQVKKAPGSCLERGIAGVQNLQDLDIKVSFLRVPFAAMPPEVQRMISPLPVGGVTDPFATPKGIQLFMLCEKIDVPKGGLMPVEKARDKLFSDKLELEVQKYMRNLRRDAFIEVRSNK